MLGSPTIPIPLLLHSLVLLKPNLKDGVSKVSSLLVAGAGYIAQKKLATKACVLIAKGAAIKIIGADAVKELSELIRF